MHWIYFLTTEKLCSLRVPYELAARAQQMGDRWATIDMGRKVGEAAVTHFFLGGRLDFHLTQCGLSRDLPPYQVKS